MSVITQVFEPINSDSYTLAIICTFFAIASIIALVFYNRKPPTSQLKDQPDSNKPYAPNRYKPLVSMALFFVFLICISTAFFSWLQTTKMTPVTINEQYVETNFGKVDWENIQNIYVHEDKQIAPFSGKRVGRATKILMIIEIGGKTHALSEDNYNIKAMGKMITEIKKLKNIQK